MKTSSGLMIIMFIIVIGTFPGMAQPISGVKIVSGSTTIYSDPKVFERIGDELYLRHYEAYAQKVMEEFKSQVRGVTGQTTREESFNLSIHPYWEFTEDNGRVLLKYNLGYNSINFRLTTADIAFGIGTGRGADPEYWLSWNMAFVYEVTSNGVLDQLNITFDGVEIKNQKLNDASFVDFVVINVYNGSYGTKTDFESWYKLSFGNFLYKVTANAALGIKDGFQNYFNEKIKMNVALLEENRLDGTEVLNVKLNIPSRTLIFEHPYSPTGIVARTATEKINDSNMKLQAIPKSSVPVSTDASTINKKALSTSGLGKKKTKIN